MAPAARFKDLCLDARDHQAVADWWCTALGYERVPDPDGGERSADQPVPIADPTGAGPLVWVNPVPEEKVVKNRLHVDVTGSTEDLLALGARLLRRRGEGTSWDVLADPEGNEFCVFAPQGAPEP